MPRQIGPWVGVSLALIVVHFVFPFLGLMSKHAKRILPLFSFWLIWLLVAHAFDLFWLIMPNVYIRQIPADGGSGRATTLPDAFKTLLESQQSVYQLSRQISSLWHAVNAPLTAAAIATVMGCCSSWAVSIGQHRVDAESAPLGALEGSAAERIPEFP